MQALISTTELRNTGYRVVQIVEDDKIFTVSGHLFWVPAPVGIVADEYWYDPSDQKFKLLRSPVACDSITSVAHNSNNNKITFVVIGRYDSVSVITQSLHGVVSANEKSLIYTPNTGYTGSDEFQYRASNSAGDSNTANVNITVLA